ncbi:hypothetical protein G6F68_021535 [Rhizopus microsporus]|nr:hypothetical protein G6F68_021535 [Rhizopus microsporus]
MREDTFSVAATSLSVISQATAMTKACATLGGNSRSMASISPRASSTMACCSADATVGSGWAARASSHACSRLRRRQRSTHMPLAILRK